MIPKSLQQARHYVLFFRKNVTFAAPLLVKRQKGQAINLVLINLLIRMDYTFLHRPKPKKFDYQPRFYNEEEDRDKMQGHVPDETEKFARRLHNSWEGKRYRKQKNGMSPVVLIGMVFILVLLLYFILH